MPLPMLAVAGGMALAGGLAGALQGDKSQTTTRQLAPASELENLGGSTATESLKQLQAMVNAGPGQADIASGASSQRDLGALLKQLMGTGGLPSQEDTAASQAYAGQAFQGQQNSLNNAFQDQRVQASRAQARMGRGGLDPVLQNKLAQEQTRQQGQLSADQGAFAAQFAQNLGGNRLNFAQQHAGVMSGLASQAMANRQTLLGMGQQLRQGEQNFRLGSASTTTTMNDGQSGFGRFLTGALAGGATGMQAANAFSGSGGGGGGLASTPTNRFNGMNNA